MRIDPLRILIAVAISLLISYGLWSMSTGMATYVLAGSLIYLSVTLSGAMGLKIEDVRPGINLSICSYLFFAIGLIINLIFSFAENARVAYILTSAISFFLYVLIADFLLSSRQ